jgi:hypothetical protein
VQTSLWYSHRGGIKSWVVQNTEIYTQHLADVFLKVVASKRMFVPEIGNELNTPFNPLSIFDEIAFCNEFLFVSQLEKLD